MAILGEAYVAIRPETAGFQTAVVAGVEPAIKAVNEKVGTLFGPQGQVLSSVQKNVEGASQVIQKSSTESTNAVADAEHKTTEHVSRIGEAFRGLNELTILGFDAHYIIEWGNKLIESFEKAETAQTQLDAAFQRFPALAKGNESALRAYNEQLSNKTTFDRNAYASGEATLAQFKLNQGQIQQLIPLVADYAQRTGKDLPTAADTVGKALLGQGRALKEVGINFKDLKDPAKNFQEVVSGLTTQVGGFADTVGQTTTGRMEIMRHKFDELKEAIGGKLVEYLAAFSDLMVNKIIPAFERNKPQLEAVANTIGTVLVGAFRILKPVVEDTYKVLASTFEFFDKHRVALIALAGVIAGVVVPVLAILAIEWAIDAAAALAAAAAELLAFIVVAGPIILALAAIGAAVALLAYVVIHNWSTIRDATVTAWQNVSAAVKEAFDAITGFFYSFGADVEHIANVIWQNVTAFFKQGYDDITGFFERLPGAVVGALGDLGSLLLNAGEKLIEGLIHGIENKVKDVGNAVKNVAQTVVNFFPHSPAKEGPLSGRGDMTLAGETIVAQLAQGMASSLPRLARSAAGVAALAGLGGGAGGGGLGGYGAATLNVNVNAPGASMQTAGVIRQVVRNEIAGALAGMVQGTRRGTGGTL